MVFVLDSSALASLPDACDSGVACAELLEELTEMADVKELCLCGASAKVLKSLSPTSAAAIWASATVKTDWFPKGDWQREQEVATALDGEADWDLLNETPEVVHVMTQALALDPDDVMIVTEDTIDKPDLLATTSAATLLGFESCSVMEFLIEAGLEKVARPD